MEHHIAKSESSDSRDALMAMGGLALIVFGVGLVMNHPLARRYLGNSGIGGMFAAAIPDLERYLKLKSM